MDRPACRKAYCGAALDVALGVAALSALLAGLYMAFLYAPREREMGEIQRIFYFHVASAWVALLAFTVTFVASALFLWKKRGAFDRAAAAAAELGVLFTTVVLITGPLWAKPVWNTWWTWDPRLTTSLILWLMYAAYLVLRANLPETPRKCQIAAVYAIVVYLDVPLVFFSIRWWRSIHPILISGSGMSMEPEMVHTTVVASVAMTLVFVCLLRLRLAISKAQDDADRIRRNMADREIL